MSGASDSSESDVSSTYRSDEETQYTCVLTEDWNKDSPQKGPPSIVWTVQDRNEILSFKFETDSPKVQVYPTVFREHLMTEYSFIPKRVKTLVGNITTLILGNSTLCGTLLMNTPPVPDKLLLDLVIIAPSIPTLVLSVTSTSDQNESSKSYNTGLARTITMAVRKTGLANYNVVHGLISSADFEEDETFHSVINLLKSEAAKTAVHQALDMNTDRCQRVMETIVVELMTGKKEAMEDRNTQVDDTVTVFVAHSNWQENFVLKTDVGEIRALKQQVNIGFIISPFFMQEYLESEHPNVISWMCWLMKNHHGWVYADRCLSKTLAYTYHVPPNHLCDMMLFTTDQPVKVLTFMISSEHKEEVIDYNTRVAKTVVDIVKRDTDIEFSVLHGVINECITEEEFVGAVSRLSSQKGHFLDMDDLKYKAVSNIWLKAISDLTQEKDYKQMGITHTVEVDRLTARVTSLEKQLMTEDRMVHWLRTRPSSPDDTSVSGYYSKQADSTSVGSLLSDNHFIDSDEDVRDDQNSEDKEHARVEHHGEYDSSMNKTNTSVQQKTKSPLTVASQSHGSNVNIRSSTSEDPTYQGIIKVEYKIPVDKETCSDTRATIRKINDKDFSITGRHEPGKPILDQKAEKPDTTGETHTVAVSQTVISKQETNTILHDACRDGRLEFVKHILSRATVEINKRGKLGRTPVMVAAQHGHWKVFDFLVSEGCDLSVVDDNQDTVLHIACSNKKADIVKYLLRMNIANMNIRGYKGRTPVMHAVRYNSKKVFDLLVRKGVDLCLTDDNKDTILNLSVYSENIKFVNRIIRLKIFDINYGRTPVMHAAFCGCRGIFDFLVRKGADPSLVDDDKNTILHVACRRNNVEFVKYLLTLNIADINVRGKWGRTPVMHAAVKGCKGVFDLLVSKGADLSVVDDDKNTILNVACLNDNMEFVNYLLTLNIAKINVRGKWGRTPVMNAAGNGCKGVFDLLVSKGADLSVVDDDKNTILNVAGLKDNVEFVKYLLTLNIAEINVRGRRGRTPVMNAAGNGCKGVFDLLVSKGADLSVVDDDKNTILNVAFLNDNVVFVKYLLTLNIADINVRGQWGRTPVMNAACNGCTGVFDLLVSKGADLSVVDDDNNTILNVACLKDNMEFVKYLLTLNTADINVRGRRGRTPVMNAAGNGCKGVFDLLVSKGADLSVVDDDNNTIFHVACLKDNMEFVKYLLTLNIAEINVRGQVGRTPVMNAAGNGCKGVFDLLVSKGADLSVVDDDKNTILNVACLNDNVVFVKYLLTLNIADINVRGRRGRTPVMNAAGNGCKGVFDLLVSKGADLSVVDDDILHLACAGQNAEL